MTKFGMVTFVILTFLMPLSGCGINGYEMNGSSFVPKLNPYGAHWVKEGVTDEQRLDDIAQCGSGRTLYVGFGAVKLKAERREGETNDFAAEERLSKAWSKCMEAKGYRYQE